MDLGGRARAREREDAADRRKAAEERAAVTGNNVAATAHGEAGAGAVPLGG